MSVQSGQAKLLRTTKDLITRWKQVRPSWRDDAARRFEHEVITVLEQRVRAATSAMQSMADHIAKAKRDCS